MLFWMISPSRVKYGYRCQHRKCLMSIALLYNELNQCQKCTKEKKIFHTFNLIFISRYPHIFSTPSGDMRTCVQQKGIYDMDYKSILQNNVKCHYLSTSYACMLHTTLYSLIISRTTWPSKDMNYIYTWFYRAYKMQNEILIAVTVRSSAA